MQRSGSSGCPQIRIHRTLNAIGQALASSSHVRAGSGRRPRRDGTAFEGSSPRHHSLPPILGISPPGHLHLEPGPRPAADVGAGLVLGDEPVVVAGDHLRPRDGAPGRVGQRQRAAARERTDDGRRRPERRRSGACAPSLGVLIRRSNQERSQLGQGVDVERSIACSRHPRPKRLDGPHAEVISRPDL